MIRTAKGQSERRDGFPRSARPILEDAKRPAYSAGANQTSVIKIRSRKSGKRAVPLEKRTAGGVRLTPRSSARRPAGGMKPTLRKAASKVAGGVRPT